MSVAEDQQLENFLKKKPEIEGDQKEIYEALKDVDYATGEEIAEGLNRKYHRISGRFGELQDKGLIQVKGTVRNSNGYKVKLWEVVE